MSKTLDLLLVTAPNRAQVYQGLSTDYAAIEPPVWSGLIARYMLSKGLGVEILDAEAQGFGWQETATEILQLNPRLAVFVVYGQQPSASTQCMPGAREVAKLLDGAVPTLVMGTHASALPGRTLLEEPFDFVCQGEGVLTIEALLTVLRSSVADYSGVPGLWYKSAGKIQNNPPAAVIQNLDEVLPSQALELLDMSRYRAHNWHAFGALDQRAPYASIQTSLGCPYRCSFCCINAPFGRSGIRYWSPENIVRQIDYLVETHGIRNIKIPDEMFVLNERHVLGIADLLIERGYNLNIWAYARVDTVKEKFLDKLKRAGFHWLALGIESSSKHVRDGVEKGRYGEQDIINTVRMIQDAGIYIVGNYIFGLPDDDLESMRQTLQLAQELNTEWANLYCAMAYPGSPLYQTAIQKNWALPEDWGGYSQHSYDCLPLPTEHLSAREVLEFRDRAFNQYFKSENYLQMIEAKFGLNTRSHIEEMTQKTLSRKLFENELLNSEPKPVA